MIVRRRRAIVTGDVAHYPAQVERIDWCASFDMDHPTTTGRGASCSRSWRPMA
jgi:hypothetical protein